MNSKLDFTGLEFKKVHPVKAKQVIIAVCEKLGLPEQDRNILADALVAADLRGVDTHGIRTMIVYAKRYQHKSLNPVPAIRVLRETPISAVIDGDNGLGHIVGYHAMKLAIQKARQTGIGMVAVRNSNHFGAAAFFTMMAQKEDLIGVALTNASARLAPTGGITPTYGNNPWSVAFPVEEGQIPIVIDMANSVVANSNIIMARELGTKIPKDWALTKDGEPTDDPNLATLLLPIGGHKGYGIAFAVEYFSAILSGSAYGKNVGLYDNLEKGQNVGHFFAVLDYKLFTENANYHAKLGGFISDIKSSKLAKGVESIYLPGEKEYLTALEREANGIPIGLKYLEEINRLCQNLGLDIAL